MKHGKHSNCPQQKNCINCKDQDKFDLIFNINLFFICLGVGIACVIYILILCYKPVPRALIFIDLLIGLCFSITGIWLYRRIDW